MNVQFWQTDVRMLLRLQTKCFIRRSFLCAWKTGRCSTQSHSMSCTLIIHRKHLPRNLPPHCPLLNYNSHDATVIRSKLTVVKALILLLLNILLYKAYFTVFPMATNYSDLFFSLFILHFSFHVVLAVEEKEKGLDKHTTVQHEILFFLYIYIYPWCQLTK